MSEIYRELNNEAEFCCVYIKEAHPLDGWVIPNNSDEGIFYDSPETDIERAAIAAVCMTRYHFPFRMALDTMDDATESKYIAEPDRLYVINSKGDIAWKSGLGPFYFDVESWYSALKNEVEKGV